VTTPTATPSPAVPARARRLCATLRGDVLPKTDYLAAVIGEINRETPGYAPDAVIPDAVIHHAIAKVNSWVRRGCPEFAARAAKWGKSLES
jgi:hypothetical protein